MRRKNWRTFQDLDSLSFYQFLVKRIDWQYLAAARSEVRSNPKIKEPAKYFSAAQKNILANVGLSVPFGSGRPEAP